MKFDNCIIAIPNYRIEEGPYEQMSETDNQINTPSWSRDLTEIGVEMWKNDFNFTIKLTILYSVGDLEHWNNSLCNNQEKYL